MPRNAFILIADAGSTKVDWALIDGDGNTVRRFETSGLNPMIASDRAVARLFAGAAEMLPADMDPVKVFYYGAGCATPEVCGRTARHLGVAFHTDHVLVASDMLGAARALLGHRPGIACILGTGSNSCLYDGAEITSNIPSMGYVLGDEGSGAALGKRLLGDAFKGLMPEALRHAYLEATGLTLADVLQRVYREEKPNAFLASQVPFIADYIADPYMRGMVLDEFTRFLRRNVEGYGDARTLPVNFIGSVAWIFGDILREAASLRGLTVNTITRSPMPGLIDYHKN